jgi:hypothetical protein
LPILLITLISGSASAQTQHKFFDKRGIALQLSNFAAQTLDGVTTQRFLRMRSGVEANPLARQFVSHGWTGQAVYSYGWGVGASMLASYWLHTHGHHRLERWVPALSAGGSAGCAGLNLRLVRAMPAK